MCSLLDCLQHKELCTEWATNNLFGPECYLKSSHDEVIWICSICHSEYKAPISYREINDLYCPICKEQEILKELYRYHSLKVLHNNLLNEWDYINNYLLCSPDSILESHIEKIWWICIECGYKYQFSPKAKVYYEKRHMKSCPHCKGIRQKKRHFF